MLDWSLKNCNSPLYQFNFFSKVNTAAVMHKYIFPFGLLFCFNEYNTVEIHKRKVFFNLITKFEYILKISISRVGLSGRAM
jgi:hypothetical protein